MKITYIPDMSPYEQRWHNYDLTLPQVQETHATGLDTEIMFL